MLNRDSSFQPPPPHLLVSSDHVGTRPTHRHLQIKSPSFDATATPGVPIFNDLKTKRRGAMLAQDQIGASSR